ncbi:hypothetical protein DYY65_06790 [Nitrososphaera sp. AFS]|nr:hypothetical protein [Nitrososphaera sp. AFS]
MGINLSLRLDVKIKIIQCLCLSQLNQTDKNDAIGLNTHESSHDYQLINSVNIQIPKKWMDRGTV